MNMPGKEHVFISS